MATLLVIDDEKSIRQTLKRLLQENGHSVHIAGDAEDAMDLLSNTAFDVVVTDIIMPRITGVNLLKSIKRASPNVQVIMMTGAPDIETLTESLRAGAFDYLIKPVSKDMLLKAVRNAVKVKYLGDIKLRLEVENRRYRENLEQQVKERTALFKAERDKLQGVLNGIGIDMYIVSRDYSIQYQNRITEKSCPDATGKICYKTYYNSTRPCEFCLMERALETKNILQADTGFQDGKSYEMIYSPFYDTDGCSKTIILMRDVTEKKTLQAEALRAGHLASIGELAAGVAHEINNPITGIISCAEILRDRFDDENESTEIPVRIIDTGKRVADIVKNLLNYSRDRKEEPCPVDIGDILSQSLALMEQQVSKDNIKLCLALPNNLPKVKVRSQELQQVFLNLLSNARYAVNARFHDAVEIKCIKITAEIIDSMKCRWIRTTIHDNGIGIPETINDKLCLPFFSTKPDGDGTGLGLHISYEIIKNHDGRLMFDSVEGEFTNVTVDLPVDNGWETSKNA